MIYSPREDSYLLQVQVAKYTKNKSFLDMGAGSGIQSETAINAGAKSVIAADINLKSINFIKSKALDAIHSDLFSNIEGRFDLIAFNPPYLPQDKEEDKESQQVTTGGKRGDELIIRFLKQAKQYLNKDGKILLLISSLTPIKKILALIKKLKMNKKKLSEKKLFMEKLEVWLISI